MKKRIFSLVIALVMVLALALPALAVDVPTEEGSLKGQIVILHTNDIHARIDEGIGYAGLAAIKAAYEKAGAQVLLFDAGDSLHGKPVATYNEGMSIVQFMNAVGYDAMAPGNHDFNYGYRRLSYLTTKMNFPVLAANITRDVDGEKIFKSNTVFNVNGVKIGVFGLATEETKTKSNPNNTKGISFDDIIDTARTQVYRLRNIGCDYVICLGHIGIDTATKIKSTDICKAVKGIDVFIDGHSHSTIENGQKVNGALVCQTGTAFANVGVVTIAKNGKITAGLVGKDAYTTKDEAIATLAANYQAKLKDFYSGIVGSALIELDGNRAPGVRTQETNLGDLAADAMLWAAKNVKGDAVAAITNGGGIRVSIPVGKITKLKLVEVFPFGNQVCTVDVPGSVLLQILEDNCQACPDAFGGFPQVSGLTFTIDTSKAYQAGKVNRVKDVEVAGEALDLSKTYTIVTNDFLAIGGDAYAAFANYEMNNLGINLEDALISFINTKLGGTVGDTYAKAAGRIIVK